MMADPVADLNDLRAAAFTTPKDTDVMAYWQRAASLVVRLRRYLFSEDPLQSRCLTEDLDAIRAPALAPAPAQRLQAFFGTAAEHVKYVASIGACQRKPALDGHDLPSYVRDIPGMDGEDSLRYYHWLSQRIDHCGDIVEAGCWFGQSTVALASGMVAGRGDSSKAPMSMVRAYDSFCWKSWMANYVTNADYEQYGNLIPRHDNIDFLPTFRRFTSRFRAHIKPYRVGVSLRHVRDSTTSAVPIALLVYDMGPDPEVLAQFWDKFSPHLVAGRSWVIFNEYGSLRSAPIWEFCRGRQDLVAAHKPPGTLKSFRYVGQGTSNDVERTSDGLY